MKMIELSKVMNELPISEVVNNLVGLDGSKNASQFTPERLAAVLGGIVMVPSMILGADEEIVLGERFTGHLLINVHSETDMSAEFLISHANITKIASGGYDKIQIGDKGTNLSIFIMENKVIIKNKFGFNVRLGYHLIKFIG